MGGGVWEYFLNLKKKKINTCCVESCWPGSMAQGFWRFLRWHWIFIIWFCRITDDGHKAMSFMVRSAEVDYFHFASWFQSQSLTAEAGVKILYWSSTSSDSFWVGVQFFPSCAPLPTPPLPPLCLYPYPFPLYVFTLLFPVFVFIFLPFWILHTSTSCVSPHPSVLCEVLLPSPACILIPEILRTE